MVPWPLDVFRTRFPSASDRRVTGWLAGVSGAHGDLVERLGEAAANLDAELWFPGPPAEYPPSVLIGPTGTIVAVAADMRRLIFRIPDQWLADALLEGEMAEIGNNWVSFDAFDVDATTAETVARLQRWCSIAHDGAT